MIQTRIIYDLRFPHNFNIVDSRGNIAEKLSETKLFTNFNFEPGLLQANHKEDSLSNSISFAPNRINGSIEKYDINIEEYLALFDCITSFIKTFDIVPFSFLGTRSFHYIESTEGEQIARKNCSNLIKNDFPGMINDYSLALSGTYDDFEYYIKHGKFNKADESDIQYLGGLPIFKSLDNGIIIDCDLKKVNFGSRNFQLKKHIDVSIKRIHRLINSLSIL